MDRLMLADRSVPLDALVATDPLVDVVQGDLIDRLDEVFGEPVDVLIHPASAVSAGGKADCDLRARWLTDVRALAAERVARAPLPEHTAELSATPWTDRGPHCRSWPHA
jgi:hypothetical protein